MSCFSQTHLKYDKYLISSFCYNFLGFRRIKSKIVRWNNWGKFFLWNSYNIYDDIFQRFHSDLFLFRYFHVSGTFLTMHPNVLMQRETERLPLFYGFLFLSRYNGPYHWWHLINQLTILFESSVKSIFGLETRDFYHITRHQ